MMAVGHTDRFTHRFGATFGVDHPRGVRLRRSHATFGKVDHPRGVRLRRSHAVEVSR